MRRRTKPSGPAHVAADALALDPTLVTSNLREFPGVRSFRVESWPEG
jgi:predicted nucleic acid-binding protein